MSFMRAVIGFEADMLKEGIILEEKVEAGSNCSDGEDYGCGSHG